MEVQFCISCQESINQSPILDHQCPEPVCLECEQSWLKSRIEDGYPLQCICGFPLTENEIKGFLSVATSNVDLEQLKSAYEKYMERRDPNIM